MIDGYDGERGAMVAGSRGYFMKVKTAKKFFCIICVDYFRVPLYFLNKQSFNWD